LRSLHAPLALKGGYNCHWEFKQPARFSLLMNPPLNPSGEGEFRLDPFESDFVSKDVVQGVNALTDSDDIEIQYKNQPSGGKIVNSASVRARFWDRQVLLAPLASSHFARNAEAQPAPLKLPENQQIRVPLACPQRSTSEIGMLRSSSDPRNSAQCQVPG